MCRCLILVLGILVAACSPVLDWRESRQSDLGFTVSLPGKPLVAARDIAFDGAALPMTMVSAGREGTLFAVGVARLPPAAVADAAAVHLTAARFADALRRNVHGAELPADAVPAVPAFTSAFAAGRSLRADISVSARGEAGSGVEHRAALRAARRVRCTFTRASSWPMIVFTRWSRSAAPNS